MQPSFLYAAVRATFVAVFVAIMAIVAIVSIAGTAEARRVALVIGNSDYKNVSPLENPGNDANDVAVTFERLGFEVLKVKDGTFDSMRRGLLDFARRARGSEIAIVFFAGHGMEVGGENYLIPIDAELKADVDVDHEAIALKTITPLVENASRLGLVILDACRNNPFASRMVRTVRTRAVSRGLAAVEPSGNVLIAFAAREGTTAADGQGRNSPFTASLLKHLETPGLEINFLFRNVRDDVLEATRRAQLPFVYGSLSREAIYLKAALPVIAPPVVQGPAADEVVWNLVKDSRDPAQFRRFVSEYPDSAFRNEAETRIAALNAEAGRKPGPDEVVWNLVKDSRDPAQFARFVTEFPKSPRRAEAETRIASLNAEVGRRPGPDEVVWNVVKDSRDPAQVNRFVTEFPKSSFRAEAEKKLAALKAEQDAANAAAQSAAQSAATMERTELARSLQFELKRVGCFDDAVTGEFSGSAREALNKFAKFASVRIPKPGDISSDTLSLIRKFDKRVCPLSCRADEKADGERCVRIVCPAGQMIAKGACVADPNKQAATPAPQRPAAGGAGGGGGGSKCFTFNNRRFCE
jgi:hypothetical protein